MSSFLHRCYWHLQRTPIQPLFKIVVNAANSAAIDRRRSLVATLPMNSDVESCAQALSRDGIADLDSAIDPRALDALSQYALDRLNVGTGSAAARLGTTTKSYWSRLSDTDSPDGMFDMAHPMVEFALQPALLAIVSRCIGALPQLSDVLLTYSEHTNGPIGVSQLWHKDFDDARTVKIFVYLTSVSTPGDGPFTFVPGPASDRFKYSLRSHIHDDEFFTHIPRHAMKQVFGPERKTFSVETSRCWHMGSRCEPGHHRLMYAATFISYPRVYPEPPARFRLRAGESEIHRLVLSSG